jgi:hypothetical protein
MNARIAALLVSFFMGAFVLSGCKDEAIAPDPIAPGAIRVANFITCGVPLDVLIIPSKGLDTQYIHNIPYGVASPYLTNLPAETGYRMIAYKDGSREIIQETSITLASEQKQSWFLYGNPALEVKSQLVDDDTSPRDLTKASVRFANIHTAVNNLDIYIDDLVGNPVFSNVPYGTFTDYVSVNLVKDHTFTFFVTNPGEKVILARMAAVTFAPGSSQTFTYGGQDTNTSCISPEERKATFPADSTRLRMLDDNEKGNDQSNPIPKSLKFFFVNGIIPQVDGRRTYNELGVSVNNDIPFTSGFERLKPFDVAPMPLSTTADGIINVRYMGVPWTDAISVKAFRVDNAAANQRGELLADYRVGVRRDIQSDMPFAIVPADTVLALDQSNAKTYPDSANMKQAGVPFLDQPQGNPIVTFLNALTRPRKVSQITANFAIKRDGEYQQSAKMKGRTITLYAGNESTAPGQVTLVGGWTYTGGTKDSIQATVTLEQNGIYFATLVGQPGHPTYGPKLMIFRTNPSGQ